MHFGPARSRLNAHIPILSWALQAAERLEVNGIPDVFLFGAQLSALLRSSKLVLGLVRLALGAHKHTCPHKALANFLSKRWGAIVHNFHVQCQAHNV